MSSNINPLLPTFGNATTASMRQNFLSAKAEIEALQNCFGFANYNDLETNTTPIVLSTGVWTNLTNDALGAQTVNKLPSDVGNIWNSTTDKFSFSTLPLYTQVQCRFDITITTSGNNQDIDMRSLVGIGSPSEYNFPLITQVRFPTAGTHQLTTSSMMFIGSNDVKSNPASLQLRCSGSATVKVAGWYLSIIKPTF